MEPGCGWVGKQVCLQEGKVTEVGFEEVVEKVADEGDDADDYVRDDVEQLEPLVSLDDRKSYRGADVPCSRGFGGGRRR